MTRGTESVRGEGRFSLTWIYQTDESRKWRMGSLVIGRRRKCNRIGDGESRDAEETRGGKTVENEMQQGREGDAAAGGADQLRSAQYMPEAAFISVILK